MGATESMSHAPALPPLFHMSHETDSLGDCPDCGAEIHPSQVLVEYETSEGETDRFVECYSCDEVVSPE